MYFKKFVGLLLTVALVFSSFSNFCYATDSNTTAIDVTISATDQQTIMNAFQDIAPAAVDLGLADIDFQQVQIANNIPVYTLKDDTLEALNFRMYPLYENGFLFAVAVVTDLQDGQHMAQIYTNIAEDLNELDIQSYDSVCFVYDASGFNVIYNNESQLLSEIEDETLDTNIPLEMDFSDYAGTWDATTVDLNYQEPLGTRATNATSYISCAITSVSQMRSEGYSNLCWAASVACIGNYKTGRNANAATIANYQDYSKPCSQAITRLNEYYSLNYTPITGSSPSDNRIYNNIANKNPMYGVFTDWDNLSHATVIYGVSATGGYVTIMDPYTPSTHTAYRTTVGAVNTYSYTSPYASSATLYLWDYGYVNS